MEVFYNKLIYFLERFLNHRYWHVTVAFITVLVILFLNAPSYFALTKEFKPCSDCVNFQEVINRADHLFKPTKYAEYSHMANTQFRLTVPLIAKLIGTRSKIVIFIIQEILGIIFLIITCLLSFRLTNDKIISAIITLSFGFIYAGKSAFVDMEGLLDSFAYFFMILALFASNKPLILSSLILAYFTDERAFLSSSLVAVFYFLEFLDTNNGKINFYAFFKARIFYVVLSWILCLITRFILFKIYGLYTPKSAAITFDLHQLGDIFWDGLKGFWLLLILGIVHLIIQKRFFILLLLTISILVVVIATCMVYDLTRSIAYIFPVIFVSLYLTAKAINKSQLLKIAIISCLISFLSVDSYFVSSGKPRYYQSAPIKIIEKVVLHEH